MGLRSISLSCQAMDTLKSRKLLAMSHLGEIDFRLFVHLAIIQTLGLADRNSVS